MCTRGGRQSSMWGAGAGLPHAAVVLHERECVWCRQTASVMCGQKASSALFRHGSVRVALWGELLQAVQAGVLGIRRLQGCCRVHMGALASCLLTGALAKLLRFARQLACAPDAPPPPACRT